MPFTSNKFLLPTNVVENEEQKLQSSIYGPTDILALINKLANIDDDAADDQTALEIIALLDDHFGSTDWRTNSGGGAMTGAEIKAAYEAESNTNAYTDAEKSKVANVPADTSTTLNTHAVAIAQNETDIAAKNSYPSGDAAKVANVPADTNAELALKAARAGSVGFVEGAANVARPDYGMVIFLTPTAPTNGQDKDMWAEYPAS